jgi:hypothetical protein
MSSHPILGYFFEPWRQLRIARDYIGEPLAARLGKARLLTIVVTRNALEPAVVSFEKGVPKFLPLPPIPSGENADALLDKDLLRGLKSQSGAAFLAVTFARLPEASQLMICQSFPAMESDVQFHMMLEYSPNLIIQKSNQKPKPGLNYRGFRHPTASLALVAAVNSDLTRLVAEAAAGAGFTVVRRQYALLQLAAIGLKIPAVRTGATLLVIDHNIGLTVTSSPQGNWEDARVRTFTGEPDIFSFVRQSLAPTLREKHQQTVVVLDTKTSGEIDLEKIAEGTSLKLRSESVSNAAPNCQTHASLLAA